MTDMTETARLASPAHAGMHPRRSGRRRRACRFPRTRGDAPLFSTPRPGLPSLPPHTRGCTSACRKGGTPSRASPAHAGMHRCGRMATATRTRFPRTRGDAPDVGAIQALLRALPPHTRGCTPGRSRDAGAAQASPAHAGMHLTWGTRRGIIHGFPRTRGDAPITLAPDADVGSLPPHTRGCTHDAPCRGRPQAASPAHAGMHPSPFASSSFPRRFPRTRGDAPWQSGARRSAPPLPPHTRGCTGISEFGLPGAVASPAHAGMHPRLCKGPAPGGGFPRTRGDAPL